MKIQHGIRAGALGTVKLGGSFDALIAKAKVVSTDPSTGTTGLDFNGDGVADASETIQRDASGAILQRSLFISQTTAKGTDNFQVYDFGNHGTITGLDAARSGHGDLFLESDPVAGKWVSERLTSSSGASMRTYSDSDGDGVVDFTGSNRKLRKPVAFSAVGTLADAPQVKLGADLTSVLAGATQLSETDGAGYRSIWLDTNGDGRADLNEIDNLDAQKQVSSRQFSVMHTNADGSQTAVGSFGSFGSDKINSVGTIAADGSSHYWYDNTGTGKVNEEVTLSADGKSSKVLVDTDGDGRADWLSQGAPLAR